MKSPAMKPPLFARALLFALAGAAEAECVAGDLEEEFAMLRGLRGSWAATRWYSWQVLRSAGPLLQLRIRAGEFTQAALLAAFGIALPLIALDRLWQFVYSRVPLKDGLDRAPQLLALNALAVCACAALIGSWCAEGRNASKPRAGAMAFAISCAAMAAIWTGIGAAPALYTIAVALAAPAAALLSFTLRRSK
jgi:hypothetical protein